MKNKSLNQKIIPAAHFLIFIPLFTHLLFSWMGFNPTDDGFTLAYSRRILEGQVPHRDFIIIRPFLSPLIHVPIVAFGYGYTYWISRLFVWMQLACIAWIWASLIDIFLNGASGVSKKFLFALIIFTASNSLTPIMAWHTIDGLFLLSIGLYVVINTKNPVIKSSGYFIIGLAYLTKQCFLVFPLLALAVLGDWRKMKYWLASALPGVIYFSFLLITGALPEAGIQLLAQHDILYPGFISYLNPYTLISLIAGYIFTKLLYKELDIHLYQDILSRFFIKSLGWLTNSIVLLASVIGGVLILMLSLFGDILGLGGQMGFGVKQGLGTLLGISLILFGSIIILFKYRDRRNFGQLIESICNRGDTILKDENLQEHLGVFGFYIVPVLGVFVGSYLEIKNISFSLFGFLAGVIFYYFVERSIEIINLRVPLLVLFAAWSVSLSIGYNFPIWAAGQLLATTVAFVFYRQISIGKNPSTFVLGLSSLILLLGFWVGRTQHIYREQPASNLKQSLEDILPGGKLIKTNSNTYDFLVDLNRSITMATDGHYKYVIIPDLAGYWVKASQMNPLPIDWQQDTELTNAELVNRVIDQMETNRDKIVLIVQKVEASVLANGFEPIETDSEWYPTLSYVRTHFSKFAQTKYFELYR